MDSIPGISHIIALKNKKNEKETFLTYDCVLCNPSGEILKGSAMKCHLRTREHLLNVLEVENYALYEKYKNDDTVSSSVLLNEVCSYEPISKKRIVATLENHASKRNMVAMNISQLKKENAENFLSQHASSSDVDTSSKIQSEETIIEVTLNNDVVKAPSEVNDSAFSGINALVHELAQKQTLHSPDQIVFTVDGGDFYIKTEQLGERVKVVRAFKLTFDNAVTSLKKREVFDKGSLIIFCCGISSVLTANVINICKKMKCSNQMMRYTVNADISSDILISKALKLQEDILNNTTNDQVMFCEFVPINISSEVRKCSNNHTFQNNFTTDMYALYMKTIEEYNKFVRYHSRLMGFKSLDLLASSYPTKELTFSEECFNNLAEIDKERVSNNITEFIIDLLQNMEQEIEIIEVVSTSKSTDMEETRKTSSHPVISCSSAKEASKLRKVDVCTIEEDVSPVVKFVEKKQENTSEEHSDPIKRDRIDKFSSSENFIEEYLVAKQILKTGNDLKRKLITENELNIDKSRNADDELWQLFDSQSEKSNNMPGLSYIISLTNGINESENMVAYDCVLCNPSESTFLKGTVMKTHIQTGEHILNVMEIENYHLYEKHKDDNSIFPSALLKEFSSCESDSKERIIATSETYEEKRKLVNQTISQLRRISKERRQSSELFLKPVSTKNIASGSPEVMKKLPDTCEERKSSRMEDNVIIVSEPVVTFENLRNIEAGSVEADVEKTLDTCKVNIQVDRYPNQIVFALDGREIYLETEQLGESVKIVRTMKLTFDNALACLDRHQILGNGSLIIFCCGVYSVLTANVISICKKNKCPNHLMRYSVNPDISADILISKALQLQEYILNNTTNDQVMFCEIVPVNISSEVRKCGNNHTFQNNIPIDKYPIYFETIIKYNKFVQDHSRLMGFKSLDLLKNSFPTKIEMPLSLDHISDLREIDKENVSNYIFGYAKEMLQNIKKRWNEQSVLFNSLTGTLQSFQNSDSGKNSLVDQNLAREELPFHIDETVNQHEPGLNSENLDKHSKNMNKESDSVIDKDIPTLGGNIEGSKPQIKDNHPIHAGVAYSSEVAKSKCIPGIAYIIALKDTLRDEKISVTYDCVLCNSSEQRSNSEKMKTHISSRKHLLNVIEVEYPELYKKYKNDESSPSSLLYEDITKVKALTVDNPVVATFWSYDGKRKNLSTIISQLRQKTEEIMSVCSMNVDRNVLTLVETGNYPTNIGEEYIGDFIQRVEDQANDVSINKSTVKEMKKIKMKMSQIAASDAEIITSVSVLYERLLNITSAKPLICSKSLSGATTLGRAFEKVVFITYPQYLEYMDEIRLPGVEIMIANPNSDGGIVSLIKNINQSAYPNTLWLTHSGIFNISRITISELCVSPPCSYPLNIVLPYDENLIESKKFLLDIHHHFASQMEEVNSYLNRDSSFLILPPFPPLFVIIEREKHHAYHQMDGNRFYFSTDKAYERLKGLFTVLSKEMIMLTISELEKTTIPREAVEEYYDATKALEWHTAFTTYEGYIDSTNMPLNPHLKLWFKCVQNLIHCVTVGDTSKSGTYCAMNSLGDLPLLQTGGYDCEVASTAFLCNKSDIISGLNQDSSGNYEHIIFIGFQEQLDLLPNLEGNTKYISTVETNDFDWKTIKKKLDSLKLLNSFNNILIVVMGSIKILGTIERESFCIRKKCKYGLSYLTLGIRVDTVIESKMDIIKSILFEVNIYFKGRSRAVMFPLFPVHGSKKPTIKDDVQHEKAHQSFIKAKCPCLLAGKKSKWHEAVVAFDVKWRTEMFKHLSVNDFKLRELIVRYFSKRLFPINWWSFTDAKPWQYIDAEEFLFRRCEFFFQIFITKMCPYASFKNLPFNAETFFGLFLVGDAFPSKLSNVDLNTMQEYEKTCQIKFASNFLNYINKWEIMDPKIMQFIVDISNSRNMSGKFSFNYAYVLGKRELRTLFDGNQKVVQHVYYEFSEDFIKDVKLISQKLGNIRSNSVCFVVFEFPTLTEKVLISPGCNKFGCEKHIPALNLCIESIEQDSDAIIIQSFILKKITELMSFVSKLSALLPVIILPFFPARIYCDEGFSYTKHKEGHLITMPDSYVVAGSKDMWEMYGIATTNLWIDFLKVCYEKYFPSDKFLGYVKEQTKVIIIEDNLKGYSSSCSEISAWNSILLALLNILVSEEKRMIEDHGRVGKSTNTHNQSSKDDEITVVDLDSETSVSRSASRSKSRSKSRSRIGSTRSGLKSSSSRSKRSRSRNRYRRISQLGSRTKRSHSVNRGKRSRLGDEKRSLSRSRTKRSLSRDRGQNSSSRSRLRERSTRSKAKRSLLKIRSKTQNSSAKTSDKTSSRKKRSYSPSLTQTGKKKAKTRNYSTESELKSKFPNVSLQPIQPAQPDPAMLLLGQDLYKDFHKDKEELRLVHKGEYDVYFKSPELHYNYETISEEFSSKFKKSGSQSLGEHLLEKLWRNYWDQKLKLIEKEDWKQKEEDLLFNYKLKIKTRNQDPNRQALADFEGADTSSTSSALRSNPPTSDSSAQANNMTGEFTVIGTLNLLEKVSGKLGMLGPAMLALSKSARTLGPNSKEAFNLFTDGESSALLKIVVSKLESLVVSAPQNEIPILSKTLDWILRLIEHTQNPPKSDINFNVNALAIASMNKTSTFTLDLIKKAFIYDGNLAPTKEEINKVYLKVCALHFEMTQRDE